MDDVDFAIELKPTLAMLERRIIDVVGRAIIRRGIKRRGIISFWVQEPWTHELGSDVENESLRVRYKEDELIAAAKRVARYSGSTPRERAAAKIAMAIPELWRDLEKNSPTWRFALIFGRALCEFPEERTADRVRRHRTAVVAGKGRGKQKSEAAMELQMEALQCATSLLNGGERPRDIPRQVARHFQLNGHTTTPGTVRTWLLSHPSGNWKKHHKP